MCTFSAPSSTGTGAVSSSIDVGCCVIIIKLPGSTFKILPAFIRRWEIQTHLHRIFLPSEGSEFEFRYGQNFSPLHVVHTDSEAHPDSYPMSNGDSFLGFKAAEA
jgi:hypothetical protein